MNKTDKVKSVQPNGTFDSQYGLLYKFEVEMENGDVGEYASKSKDQTKFVTGQEVYYEFIPHEKFPKIKPAKKDDYKPQPKGDNVQLLIVRQNALGHAMEYNRMLFDSKNPPTLENIANDAEFFKDYVFNGIGGKSEQHTESIPPPSEAPPPNIEDPF